MNIKLALPTRLTLGTLLVTGFIAPLHAVPQTNVVHLLCTGDAYSNKGGQGRLDIDLQNRTMGGLTEGSKTQSDGGTCTTTMTVTDAAYAISMRCSGGSIAGYYLNESDSVDRVTGHETDIVTSSYAPQNWTKTAECKVVTGVPAF
jgi:hypothetical protein